MSIVHLNSEQIHTTSVNKQAKSFKNEKINLIKRNSQERLPKQ